jgi:beta-glucanase (GH16 family)
VESGKVESGKVKTRVKNMLRLAVPMFAFVAMSGAQSRTEWTLTFSEEFNGTELEFPKWTAHDPWGKELPREAQAYIAEAVAVSDGRLRITAKRERARYAGRMRDYTSGFVTTWGSFAQTYGRFEIRCRMPAGRGLEPKFWLLPLSGGEMPSIDVVDVIGSEPSKVLFTNRWGDEQTERSYFGNWSGEDFSAGFHVFAVEWNEAKIIWSVDGKPRFESTEGIPKQPLCLGINLAVGGLRARYPDNATMFPAAFEIDYVRVYQKK